MAGGRLRKRVEVEKNSSSSSTSPAASGKSNTTASSSTLLRAKDGSAFTKCGECNKDVAVALISMHDCSTEAKIKMNLEAQVVEKAAELKKKPAEKRKAKAAEPKAKKGKKAKNPNALKRPPTAFFIFMDDFRKSFKEANPDCKSVSVVAKEGGEKWKSMTEEEKQPYVDRAAELKAEYERALESNGDGAENEDGEENSAEKEVEEIVVDDDE
ncbi:unnamed protein product [Coffea canephora]|uniref:HMG box domain-containing protein n=2 Tax=Coffea TaxID=13442 RepID=A0A068V8Z3_COFCA|nr:high mobility group B protein 7-like [Coffea arabica]CDP16974.1 unnamed protein product [Coffea canephora]